MKGPPLTSTSRSTAHSALSPYGWDEDWADAFAPYAAEGLLPGRVVRVDRGQCDVVTPDGVLRADTAFVTPHDPLRVVCTGDWVAVEPDGNPRYVRTYLPRRTAFVRSTSSKRSEGQILAANVDHAIVAVSLAVELDLARVERFLALAWESGAQPLVVLTKADLVPDPVTLAHLVQDVETSAPGVTVLAVSAALGRGWTSSPPSSAAAPPSCSASPARASPPSPTPCSARTSWTSRPPATWTARAGTPPPPATSSSCPAGSAHRHPGLRGVGLWDAGGGVGQVFAEIEELARDCRFHDCAHESEPGCAVLAAIDDGELPERRLESYRKLMRENQRIVAKTDARLRAEIRKEWKRRGAIGKAAMEAKRGHLR